MKKVIVVSKTHLDLGFTDYAEVIRKKYIDSFIPGAITLSQEVREKGGSFLWTTGSWILKEALESGTEENKRKLTEALKNGNIAPHAMPFTTHTELLDEDTLEYGLSIVDAIDQLTGRKTIAAKMTDVPGHTKALIPMLCRHGIKLLHIGVNGASAMPEVPQCFVWKYGSDDIIVIYSGDYGGEYRSELIDDILYFDHTLDNHGASGAEQVMENLAAIQAKYPDYEVKAGRLDDYAELLLKVKDKLPVIEGEIGDSWIHGSAADPYKSASLRTLMALKRKWLADGSMDRNSEEYVTLADNLLCLAEHTCGMDVKIALGDFEHYLRPDFEAARQADDVKMVEVEREFFGPADFTETAVHPEHPVHGSYRRIEGSWAEQRKYIVAAVAALSPAHRKEADTALAALMPKALVPLDSTALTVGKEYVLDGCAIAVNRFGGIARLVLDGEQVLKENDRPVLSYHLYGKADYDFWLHHYSRNVKETSYWSISDFCRPLIGLVDDKFPKGSFDYTLEQGSVAIAEHEVRITADLKIDEELVSRAGAPAKAQLVYTLKDGALTAELRWLEKSANRLTESMMLHFYPAAENSEVSFQKLGQRINPFDIVKSGSRNLAAVQQVNCGNHQIVNCHSPLVSIGQGKILEFDNRYEDVSKDGISFVLYDNVWGTNFPLWYEDNAYFKFFIK